MDCIHEWSIMNYTLHPHRCTISYSRQQGQAFGCVRMYYVIKVMTVLHLSAQKTSPNLVCCTLQKDRAVNDLEVGCFTSASQLQTLIQLFTICMQVLLGGILLIMVV